MNIKSTRKGGFTIIETMIAISVFLVVVMVGMGSLISVSVVHQKSQDMRSIMDSLSFVLDDISRNVRTAGLDIKCPSSSSSNQDCAYGASIGFTNQYGDVIIYKFDTNNQGRGRISKSVDGGGFVPMTLQEIDLDTNSSFTVVGALRPSVSGGDTRQPFVTIRLSGTITSKEVVTPFSIQTSVSQRAADINP